MGRAPSNLAGAAAGAACRSTVATLESALAAAKAVTGSYPPTLEELRDKGFVSQLPAVPGLAYAVETENGQPTGRVLVNGVPAGAGCP